MTGELWHFDGRTYRLVNPKIVSYPRWREVRDPRTRRTTTEKLPPLEYTVVTAIPVLGGDREG